MITIERVEKFIEERIGDITSEISDAVNTRKSSVEYESFCEDEVEIDNVEVYGDKGYVQAKGSMLIGYLTMTQDGPWPDDRTEDVQFTIIVEEDSEGNLKYVLPMTEDRKVDAMALLVSSGE